MAPFIGQDLRDVRDEDMNAGGWTALPDGEYVMIVTASDYLKNKRGDGHNLKLAVQTVDPQYRGAKWFEFLALDNPSVDATRIARAKLKQLAIAVGVRDPNRVEDSGELHNRPFTAVVTAEAANDPKYGDRQGLQNRIKAFRPRVGAAVPTQADAQAKQSVAQAKADNDVELGDLPF